MVEHDKKIMHRLSEHLDAVKEKHPEWVGIFLQGSQNYKLDYEGSDVDSKLIILPSFEDFVLNRKPQSYTHIMENDEHVVEESLKQYTHALITNHLALCVRNAAISVFSQSLSPVGRR